MARGQQRRRPLTYYPMKTDASAPRSSKSHTRYAAICAAIAISGLATLASTTTPGASTPTAAPYIEQPQPTVTTYTTYSTYTPSTNYGPSSFGGYYNSSYSGSYSTTSTTYYPRRYFFPPTPPALGEAYVRNRTKSASLTRSTIPISLADYVNEPFYSPLSPFLYEESLSKKRQKTLDDYLATKQALISELRAKLDAVSKLSAADREAQLADFAREQTPRVAALEKTAYEIRDDLTQWRLFSAGADWNEGRDWRLGDNTRWESTLDEAKVMRGAAFFQDGLAPAQRRLLREHAMELDESGREPTTDMALDARGPFFYFSPETSRLRLPPRVPAALQAKIDEYRRLKTELKKELRDVLYREDRSWFDSHRTSALRNLAAKQAPQLALLDPLAEEIRRGLAALPNPARPQALNKVLPGSLSERIGNYMRQKAALQRDFSDQLNDVRRRSPSSRVEYVKVGETYVIQVVANRKMNEQQAGLLQAAKVQLAAFNDEHAKTFVSLIREKEEIREALIEAAGPLSSVVTPKVIDVILHEHAAVLQQQELWNQYTDYENAVLQPGLSPEQRRMLYDGALVKLDQQLPYYTY